MKHFFGILMVFVSFSAPSAFADFVAVATGFNADGSLHFDHETGGIRNKVEEQVLSDCLAAGATNCSVAAVSDDNGCVAGAYDSGSTEFVGGGCDIKTAQSRAINDCNNDQNGYSNCTSWFVVCADGYTQAY